MGQGHSHDHAHGANQRSVGLAALLTGLFMLAEVVGGLLSGSLALLADAGHMLTDFASLLLAWIGFHLARRPADQKRSFGYGRFPVLVAFVNGISLFAIAIWICVEAWHRLNQPVEVLGGLMLIVAIAGLAVNIAAFWVLSRGDRNNLNIKAALLHVAGDLLGSVAAIVAAAVILLTGWVAADPILSVLVALIILRSAWVVVRDSSHILLEGVPSDVDLEAVAADLENNVEGVWVAHHLHAWQLTETRRMMTLHLRVAGGADGPAIADAVRRRLHDEHDIDHATIEIERDNGETPDVIRVCA